MRPTLEAVLSYAITDRSLFRLPDDYRRRSLVHHAARWAAERIDFIQIREKDLPAGELAELTRRIQEAVAGTGSKVLVNSRADVAVAAGADGVHLTAAAGELTPEQVRTVFAAAGRQAPIVSVSCHTIQQAQEASAAGVDAILFGPVFAKVVDGGEVVPGTGIETLRTACTAARGASVFALGGLTLENAPECIEAGAAGVAGIRLFHRK